MEPIGSLLDLLTHPCKHAGKSIIVDISATVAELWVVRIRLVVVVVVVVPRLFKRNLRLEIGPTQQPL
jgi:hypothetical protein